MEILAYINLIFAIIIVFFQRKDPKSVWGWLLILYFVPVLGFVFYILVGTDMHKAKMFRTKEIEDKLSDAIRRQEASIKNKEFTAGELEMAHYSDLVLYNLQSAGAILSDDNEMRIITDGREKFKQLFADLESAKHSIHIQYYIIKNDEIFAEMKDILLRKAKAGVEVRVLFDAMGCRTFRKKEWKSLREAGVEVAEFFPALFGRLQLRINYRNHRKIVVIDGKVGYVGGFNVAREYVGADQKFGYWRDTHMRITGSVIQALQGRFILDWNYACREHVLPFDPYMAFPDSTPKKGIPMQIISSGPDTYHKSIRDTYLMMIHKAKKNIYIQTPYFIPDEAILAALMIAVQSGITVNIMIPCKPDHPFVYWATYSYVGELVMAGANCYTYENGFLHAKGVVIDDEVFCYGTANMDIRSFSLNFEVNAIVYDKQKAAEMARHFIEDLKVCKKITKNNYLSRPLWMRFKEQVCRLFSPVL